jgi:hypothetical protein
MSTGTSSMDRRTPVAAAAITALLAVLLLSCCASAHAATAPYEPNDSTLAAAGPLGSGQVITAAIESSTDRDFFYFYATAAKTTPISVTVHSLGGNNRSASGLNASLLDAIGSPLATMSFIRDGEVRTATAPLQAQKYFVEVSASEGFGDAYELAVSGPAGAVGPFSQITAQCVGAEGSVEQSRAARGRAEAKLQRVVARVQRSRYSSAKERSSARAAAREAQAVLRRKRAALREARTTLEPWCSIAP